MKRVHQTVLIVSTMLASWLGMQAVHEAGHVLGALVSGGSIKQVVLHPLTISRTDLAMNPAPLVCRLGRSGLWRLVSSEALILGICP